MKTRAAIVEERGGPFRVEEVELADPGRGEARVRIEACGICRSDLHAIDGNEDVVFPAVLGHEAAGIVDACGPDVASLAAGDRVVLSWTPACGQCASCNREQPHLCAGIRMSAGPNGPLTWNGKNLDRFMGLGAFSEHVVVPEGMAIAVRGEIPASHACLIGCGVMTGFGAATKTAGVGRGDRVAVIGCGGVGLAAVQAASIAGASRIFAIDPLSERRDLALRLGATDGLDSANAVAAIVTDAGGVDVAIECVGRTQTMEEAFAMLRPGGCAVVVGLPDAGARLRLDPLGLLVEKSLTGSMYGSADPRRDFPKLVALYDQGRLDLATLVAGELPLAEINDGIEQTRRGPSGRIVITF
jgi:S-(hydroxymethyl)glutathione dehydrogenase/alcohol dehydrogenase